MVKMENQNVTTAQDVQLVLARFAAGNRLRVTVQRGDPPRDHRLELVVGENGPPVKRPQSFEWEDGQERAYCLEGKRKVGYTGWERAATMGDLMVEYLDGRPIRHIHQESSFTRETILGDGGSGIEWERTYGIDGHQTGSLQYRNGKPWEGEIARDANAKLCYRDGKLKWQHGVDTEGRKLYEITCDESGRRKRIVEWDKDGHMTYDGPFPNPSR